MLIRLCGHFINNPARIDKMICIKGLPEEWIFRPSRFGGKELIAPWEPDIEANIPESVRHLCEPFEVTFSFPPIEKGQPYITDKRLISSLRFDYMTEAGQSLWEKVQRYLDKMTPRDQRIPDPVLVAPDQRSAFDPHMARRSMRGSLELVKAEIPVVDLREPVKEVSPPIVNAPIIPKIENTTSLSVKADIPVVAPQILKCDQCEKVYEKERAMKMHKMVAHKKKEIVGV